jgi:hypothetical protein
LALTAGALTLVPLASPILATAVALLSLIVLLLSSRYPEKHAGRNKVLLALGLSLLGMTLFFVEGDLFWRWKISQAYDQRVAVTRLRIEQVAQAMEQYRQEKGAYPEISGIMMAKAELEPQFAPQLPVLDGFDGAISVMSHPEGFRVIASLPPPPGSEIVPQPMVRESGFQPAPTPPPPAQPQEGPPSDPAIGEGSPDPAAGGLADPVTQSADSVGAATPTEAPQPPP